MLVEVAGEVVAGVFGGAVGFATGVMVGARREHAHWIAWMLRRDNTPPPPAPAARADREVIRRSA